MIDYGTAADKKAVKQLLKTHHRVDIIVMLMDVSHNHLAEHSDRLLGGQVNIDTTADTTRTCSIDLRDPKHRLKADDFAPDDGSLSYTKMIRIIYVLSPPDNSAHYPIPIFTGPINDAIRNGPVITLEAVGKEALGFGSIWAGRSIKKGIKKVEAILMIMKAAGETRFRMINRDSRMGNNISASRSRKFTFWKLARKIANGMNLHLFYDGRGVLVLRRIPTKSVYEFQDDTVMTSYPQVTTQLDDNFCNAVEIIGGKPKGAKKKVHYKLVAPRHHPLSPWNMGRNGTPRYIPRVVEDDSIKSLKAAKTRAKKELGDSLYQDVQVSFDSLAVPFLEEFDPCRYRTDISSGQFKLKQMSTSLTVDGTSSIGYIKRTGKPRYKGTRRRRKGSHGVA